MSDRQIVWFRRGDGMEFAVPEDSDAYRGLVAQGAVRIKGPGAAAPAPAADSTSYASMKVDALRALLAERELETSGRKDELVARLEEADAAATSDVDEDEDDEETDGSDEDPDDDESAS